MPSGVDGNSVTDGTQLVGAPIQVSRRNRLGFPLMSGVLGARLSAKETKATNRPPALTAADSLVSSGSERSFPISERSITPTVSGGTASTWIGSELEVPPLGAGLTTAISAASGETNSAAGIAAFSSVLLTTVVWRETPFH